MSVSLQVAAPGHISQIQKEANYVYWQRVLELCKSLRSQSCQSPTKCSHSKFQSSHLVSQLSQKKCGETVLLN